MFQYVQFFEGKVIFEYLCTLLPQRTASAYREVIYIYIYFFKLAFVLFLFVLLLQYLNFFGTKITENVPDCNVYYVLFSYPDKTYVRDFSEVYKFSYKRGLRSWRFCCVSQSKSYSRAKAESRDLLQVDFSYSSQVLKSERSKSLGITNQDKKIGL